MGEGSNAVQHCLWVDWEWGIEMRGKRVKQHNSQVPGRQGEHKDKKILAKDLGSLNTSYSDGVSRYISHSSLLN